MLSAGLRLRSQVCPTEIVVVRAAAADLTCGGHPMIPIGDDPAAGLTPDPALSGGNQLGKRYTNAEGDLEVLVTKPGDATIADGAAPLLLKAAKPLPSSD